MIITLRQTPYLYILRLAISGLALCVLVLIFSLLTLRISDYRKIEKRYGFRYATPELRRWPCYIEPLMIIRVDHGGAFDMAGFKEGDILTDDEFVSVESFFKTLDKPSGTVIFLSTIEGDMVIPECDFDTTGLNITRKVIAP